MEVRRVREEGSEPVTSERRLGVLPATGRARGRVLQVEVT